MEKKRQKLSTKQIDDRNFLKYVTSNARNLLCKESCKDVAVLAMDEKIKDLERRIKNVEFDFDAMLENYFNGFSKYTVDIENIDGEKKVQFKDSESRESENGIY